jgi:hypothetical protein
MKVETGKSDKGWYAVIDGGDGFYAESCLHETEREAHDSLDRFLNPSLVLEHAPCHVNYGESHCCGIFNTIRDGNLICNECGMGIFELLETQAGREVKPNGSNDASAVSR